MYGLNNKRATWVAWLNPRRSLRARLGLAIGSSIFLLSLLLAWGVGSISKAQVERDGGKFVEQLAYQMANDLDRGMFVYFQEIQTLATLDTIRNTNNPQSIAQKRALLENLQRAYNDYAWRRDRVVANELSEHSPA
jgi:hypothetical protein